MRLKDGKSIYRRELAMTKEVLPRFRNL